MSTSNIYALIGGYNYRRPNAHSVMLRMVSKGIYDEEWIITYL